MTIKSFLLSLQMRITAPSVSWEFPVFQSWKLRGGKVSFLTSSWDQLAVRGFFVSCEKCVEQMRKPQNGGASSASLHKVTCSTQLRDDTSRQRGIFSMTL